MKEKPIFLQKLIDWTKNPTKIEEWNIELMSDLRSAIYRAIYNKDHDLLIQLRNHLSPAASLLRRNEEIQTIPINVKQAIEISVLAGLLRSIVFIMEEDDPNSPYYQGPPE